MPTKTVNTTPNVDDLDAMLGGDIEGEEFGDLANMTAPPVAAEVEIDLGALDLSSAVEKDFRPLNEGHWYEAEIVGAVGGRSSAGNLQIVFTLMVVDCEETDEGGVSFDGVTVDDYAGVDPAKPANHWKIKGYARCCGYLNDNGTLKTSKAKDFIGKRIKFLAKIDREYNPAEPRNKVGKVALCGTTA